MHNILKLMRQKRLYFDGGMGSMLQKRGLKPGELPENWNLEHPEIIEDIHRQYLLAGANIITTNTFGVNSLKHANYRELIITAVECAKRSQDGFKNSFVAFDIGPIGRFIQPIGDLPFEDAVDIFAQNVRVANECGVDLIIIETMSDSYETKAAVLAAKENSDLPIFVTNVYDEVGKTLTGSNPESMIAMLEGLGVDAIGLNCSVGPDKMIPLIDQFVKYSSLPIICNPNAGLPEVVDGKAHYSLNADAFSDYAVTLAQGGVHILGGCCGTEPEYIKKTVEKTKDIPLRSIDKKNDTVVSSYSHTVRIETHPILIGERINPTGKPKLKQALIDGDMNYLMDLALNQSDAGAHILDVNVGVPTVDEVESLAKAVSSIQSVCDLPLQLDSNNATALEVAMRIYNGKPLINSVNGDESTMDAIFPLVRKYGGVLIALTLDNNGIPDSPSKRIEIANRIIEKAAEYGVEPSDIIFDPLALTVATNPENADITLETVKQLHELGYKTSLGISNVSFGMPNRDTINVPFFARALLNGLSCAIMNPSSKALISVNNAFNELLDGKISLVEYENRIDDYKSSILSTESAKVTDSSNISLKEAVVRGLIDKTVAITHDALNKFSPMEIINSQIIPALNEVGEGFENQKIFLPQLLKSAECSSKAFAIIKDMMPSTDSNGNGVVLATVKGDIHDIGKNIVKLLLESYGFKVYDLGKDVSSETVLEAVIKYKCNFVALSALMTTTLPSMEKTAKMLHDFDTKIKVMVGGAVVIDEYAKSIGADYYAKDALSAVRCAQNFYK